MTDNSTIGEVPAEVDVAIVGAGIGGLAAAVALHAVGVDAHVFERTRVLGEVGGSIVIREPSVDLMEQWGVADRFRAASVPFNFINEYDAAGTPIRTSLGDVLGDGQPYSVHRADVHALLLDAVPADRVHLGRTAVAARNEADRAVVEFDSGLAVRARLVVAADGIKSVLRRVVVDDELTFARLIVLRSLSPASALPEGVTNDRINVWSQGEKLLMGLPLRGGDQVALDTVVQADEPPAELWNTQVPISRLVEGFVEFDPGIGRLLTAGSETVLASPVHERAPIDNWSVGRITLLGDAAHPMAPRQGQGANQAIQDAGALAAALAEATLDDVPGALAVYQEQRVAVAAAMQRASQTNPDLRPAPAEGAAR